MEVKKVQEVKGSYYVYLPKPWCIKYIEGPETRKVRLKLNEDDSLLILPMARQISEDLELSLEINESINEDSCLNSLLAAYIVGVKCIELKTNDKFSLEFRDRISQLLKPLIGFEITEETQDRIVIHEVSTTLKLEEMMRRILSKVGLILKDLADILKNLNKKGAEVLINQDDEVDKFRYSIERQVHQILRQPVLIRELKITPIECLHLSQCTKYLERIADHCVGIATFIIEGKKPSPNLLQIYEEVRKLYMQMQNNFYSIDVEANYQIISQHHQIIASLDEIELEKNNDKLFAIPLKRICSYCSDIAEVRINSFVYKLSLGKVSIS